MFLKYCLGPFQGLRPSFPECSAQVTCPMGGIRSTHLSNKYVIVHELMLFNPTFPMCPSQTQICMREKHRQAICCQCRFDYKNHTIYYSNNKNAPREKRVLHRPRFLTCIVEGAKNSGTIRPSSLSRPATCRRLTVTRKPQEATSQ